MLSLPKFWIIILVIPLFALVPDIILALTSRIMFPTPVDKVMAI
jgi:hypothetical protein